MRAKTQLAILGRPGVVAFAGAMVAVVAISLGVAETRPGDEITLCVASTCPATPKPSDCGAVPGATAFKIEDPSRVSNGPYTDGTLSVEVSVDQTSLGETFDWTSTLPVGAVVVKGGPDRNVYAYDPVRTSDGGLHAPMNEANGKYPDLSYVVFCYQPMTPTPTPTEPPPTPTPTEIPVPTDTPGPTESPGESASPSWTPTPAATTPVVTPAATPARSPAVAPVTVTPSPTQPTQVLGRTLPRTGTYLLAAIAVALFCVALGLKLVDVGRRSEAR